MSNETIQAIEENIRRAKKIVESGDALERLRGNRDFKRLVLEGYFEQEAVRLVHLKSDPSMQSPESQKAIVSQIDAIGSLAQYFTTTQALAAMARKSIASDEEARDEILEEDLSNG